MSGGRLVAHLACVVTLLAVAGGLAMPPVSWAHDTRPAHLELVEVGEERYEMRWRLPVFSGRRLPVLVRLPEGVKTVGTPEAREFRDSVVERRMLEAPGGLVGKRIAFTGLEATITDVLVRVERRDGSRSATLVRPSEPWIELSASRARWLVAGDYLTLGVEHILLGFDHLAFVLALCLIVPSGRVLLWTITAFTVAHSITLAIATLGVVHVPSAPLEASIALSIVLLAREALGRRDGEQTLAVRWPWVVAFAFGLLHGFGFASALTEVGLPSGEVPVALFAFNVGVELGQLGFLGLVFSVGWIVRRVHAELRVPIPGRSVVAYAIGSVAALWFFERLTGFVP